MIRLPVRRGADHPRALFTSAEVEAIRQRVSFERVTIAALAREKGCCKETIRRLLRGASYR